MGMPSFQKPEQATEGVNYSYLAVEELTQPSARGTGKRTLLRHSAQKGAFSHTFIHTLLHTHPHTHRNTSVAQCSFIVRAGNSCPWLRISLQWWAENERSFPFLFSQKNSPSFLFSSFPNLSSHSMIWTVSY